MKRLLLMLAVVVLAAGSLLAKPRFKSISGLEGKTTIEIEVPAKDRNAAGMLSIDKAILHVDGQELKSRSVSTRTMREYSIIKLVFDHVPDYTSSLLTFNLNGEPCSIDVGKQLR